MSARRRCLRMWRGERGSGTVLAIGLVLTAAILCLAVAVLARAQAARGAAQAAADLGALAAAERLAAAGGGSPGDGAAGGTDVGDIAARGTPACVVAAAVVAANHAVLTGCELLGRGVVRVSTARDAGVGVARASARAGPAAAR